jgi:hypothetical protein
VPRDPKREIEFRVAISAVHEAAIKVATHPGQRADHPVGADRFNRANRIVEPVGHIKPVVAVHRNRPRTIEPRFAIGPIIETFDPGKPGHGADHPVGADGSELPDRLVVVIRDKEIAGGVNGKPAGAVETRLVVGPVRRTERAGQAGQGGHDPVGTRGRQLANRMVEQVRNVNIPRAVHGKPGRLVKPRITVGAIGSPTKPGHTRDGGEGVRLPSHIGHRSRPQAAEEQDAEEK